MTAANNWTKEMLVKGKGFYEIQDLYGRKDDVICPDLLRFPHNYNTVTRGHMYSWFKKHLKLGLEEPITEKDFKLFTREEHAVWTDKHPKPAGGDAFERKLTRPQGPSLWNPIIPYSGIRSFACRASHCRPPAARAGCSRGPISGRR